jgi:hypothetical protein
MTALAIETQTDKRNLMKASRPQSTGGRACGSGTLAATASLLLATLPLAAADPPTITGTGYLVGVPVPGILCTNTAGQVSLKGNVHVLMVQADDPRATGRFQASMDLAYQADGTALFGGAAYQEVGTWDVADPANPKFTPSGGLWHCNYHGVAQPDGSDVITLTGYGVGGAIDGLQLEETITKGPGAPFDPPVPYLGSGTIKPAPVDTRVVLEDFDDNRLSGLWTRMSSNGQGTISKTNQQFTVRGYWPGVRTASVFDSWAKGWISKTWTVADGQTLEWRVDLVRMSESASMVYLAPSSWSAVQAYVLAVGHGFAGIIKVTSSPHVLCGDQTTIKNTNVVLSLAMTRVQTNLVLTARVLDKDNQLAVLYQRSVVDTPQVDPSLTTAEVEAMTGMHLFFSSDPRGSPLFSGDALNLEVFQYNDGTKPAADVTFDNLELRAYEVPPVSIERAVRLTWPASPTVDFAVEGSPTVQGPWLPLIDQSLTGRKQMTIPANGDMQFFRLR